MVAITVRNVPEPVREALALRAEREGASLQEFVRLELERLATRPTIDEWLDDVRSVVERSGTRLTAAEILKLRDADRE
jgi:plasmid stability protein